MGFFAPKQSIESTFIIPFTFNNENCLIYLSNTLLNSTKVDLAGFLVSSNTFSKKANHFVMISADTITNSEWS